MCGMAASKTSDPITLQRLERGLAIAALAVSLDGPKYLPIFKRMEAEVAKARADEDDVSRALNLAAAYTRGGGMRAIR